MAVEHWVSILQMKPHTWTCGFCGLNVGGNRGYYLNQGALPNSLHQGWAHPGHPAPADNVTSPMPRIFICPNCDKPTFFDRNGKQTPGVSYGAAISHLPSDVDSLYSEARNCMSVSAFTASVLATRKLLMNTAVSQGGKENGTFQYYVQYLAEKGYVPPNATPWVNHIRDKGNDATHEIPAISENDAKDLLTFMEMILKLVFEYPNRVPKDAP